MHGVHQGFITSKLRCKILSLNNDKWCMAFDAAKIKKAQNILFGLGSLQYQTSAVVVWRLAIKESHIQ